MKSLKKTLVLLVVFSMILSTLVPAFAFDDVAGLDCEDQVTRMVALGIIKGMEDGTFQPEKTITRAEMAVIICKMVGINEAAANANANVASKFSDVPAGQWYTGWVNLASNNGIISGYPDGTFRPNQTLTLNEVLTLCVKALGRGGYVDKMGTWPANYVTEAARLNLLKDVKGASDANRGNVAVIAWNTLKAPTWYVNSESLDGEVNLSDANGSGKTLLAINFAEYTHKDSTAEGKLKEVTATVADTPARNTEIGERQIILSGVTEAFDFKAKTDYKKAVREERTYTADGNLVAYVPEEVCEDIDSLRNKNVTVVFGEDNIVALITIDDTTMEKDFLTKYSVADNEITVGGEKYELADAVTVVVNDTPMAKYVKADEDGKLADADAFAAITATKYTYTDGKYVKAEAYTDNTTVYYVVADQLAEALTIILGSVPTKSFDKAIEAEVTLNDDEDVEKIVLFVSGNYVAFNTVETVATRIKSEKIETVAGNITWDDDDDDYEYPRVYVDGVKAEITDIEAGDVLTIFGAVGAAKNITVIYASRKTVEGEVSRVKNDLEIYVDGEVYYASNVIGKNALNLDGELKELVSGDTESSFDSIHGETAVLYLNVLGEYVLVDADTVEADWTFAVVDHIYDVVEDEEIDDVYSQKLRLFMMDGSKNRNYKLVYDKDDYYSNGSAIQVSGTDKAYTDEVIGVTNPTGDTATPDSAKNGVALTGKVVANKLIAFKANADGEIELKDVFEVDTTTLANNSVINGYNFIKIPANYDTITFDTKRIDSKIYEECTETTHTSCTDDLEVVASGATDGQVNVADVMNMTVTAGDIVKLKNTTRFKVTSNTLLADMAGKESITWKNLISEATHSASVDTLLVYEDDATELAFVIALTTPAGVTDAQYALVLDATYTTSRTDKAVKLVGVDGEEYIYEYAEAEEDELVEGMLISYTLENGKINAVDQVADLYEIEDTTDVKTELSILGEAKGAYEVKTFDDDYLTYTDDDTDFAVLANRFVDVNTDDVVVVSYADDTFTTVNFDAETLEGEYVLYFNTDSADGVELLIIVK